MERSERNARDAVHVIASQERQGDDEKMIARHSVAVVLLLLRWLLRLLSLRFGPMWLAAPAPLAPSPLFLLPSSLPLHLKDNNLAPSNNLASIWHSQKYRTRVSAQFRFYTQMNMVFTSYLIYIYLMYLNLI